MNSIYFEMLRDMRNTVKNIRSFFGIESRAIACDLQRAIALGMSERDCAKVVSASTALCAQVGH